MMTDEPRSDSELMKTLVEYIYYGKTLDSDSLFVATVFKPCPHLFALYSYCIVTRVQSSHLFLIKFGAKITRNISTLYIVAEQQFVAYEMLFLGRLL